MANIQNLPIPAHNVQVSQIILTFFEHSRLQVMSQYTTYYQVDVQKAPHPDGMFGLTVLLCKQFKCPTATACKLRT